MDKFGYVLAPKVLVINRLKVRFMYRENSESKSDSGWRFFSGDEDQSYVDNPNNIGMYDIETILAIDTDVKHFLNSPVGSAFERESADLPFTSSIGFDFGVNLDE